MNNKMKKIVFLFLFALSLSIFSVSAYTPKELSQYAKEISEVQKWTLDGNVELKKQNIATIYNGVTGDEQAWNNHTVQWLTVPKENTAIQTVVWSDGETEEWDASDVEKTAKDYERSHPGYIVVGAVNGDFFYINDTQEPLNYHVQEGDVLRSSWDGDPNWGVIGFKHSKDYVVGLPSRSESMYLKKITDTETTELSTVAGTNVAPSGEGVYVYTKSFSGNVDLTGYNVYKVITHLYREYRDGYFVKGKVDRIENITNLSSIAAGTFYVATKNIELNVDDMIKVEYNVTGAVAGADNVVGYCYPCLSNKKPLFQNISPKVMDGYFTTLNPRTLVGFKEDGSVVLMVIDGRGSVSENLEGATLFQCGELLRLAGCVEGYNLDGGGSSTLMARINGKLTLINDPSDARQTGQPWGTLRGIGNAILLVMKDPKIQIDEAIGNTIKIRRIGEVVDGKLENIKVKVDGKTYDLTDDELIITDLDKSTNYKITYEYDIRNNDGTIEHGISEPFYRGTEDFTFPTLKDFSETKMSEACVTLKYGITANEEDVTRIYIKNGDNEVILEGLSGRIKLDNLDTTIKNEFILMVELKNGMVLEIAKLTYDENTIPGIPKEDNPSQPGGSGDVDNEEKSGCKKDAGLMVISLVALSSLFALFRKRK